MLEEKYKTLKDPTLAKILLKLDVKDIQKTYPSIWKKSNPLLKSVRNDQLTLMTSLQAIGGQVSYRLFYIDNFSLKLHKIQFINWVTNVLKCINQAF